jgi:hypothetical protein
MYDNQLCSGSNIFNAGFLLGIFFNPYDEGNVLLQNCDSLHIFQKIKLFIISINENLRLYTTL